MRPRASHRFSHLLTFACTARPARSCSLLRSEKGQAMSTNTYEGGNAQDDAELAEFEADVWKMMGARRRKLTTETLRALAAQKAPGDWPDNGSASAAKDERSPSADIGDVLSQGELDALTPDQKVKMCALI